MTREEVYGMIEMHYRDHFSNLVKRNIGTCGGKALSEEAVQEAYTRCCQYWDSYEEGRDFTKWFNCILINCIKTKVKEERDHGAGGDGNEVADVQARAFNKVMLSDVRAIIDKQTENIRNILMLFFFGEYTTLDISNVVPETHSNIRVIIHNFRKKLRVEFGGERLFE